MRWSRPSNAATDRDGGHWLALLIALLFAIVGVVVVAAPLLLRVKSVRDWVTRTVAGYAHDELGLTVAFTLDRPTWPPGVILRDIRVDSTTEKRPFATSSYAQVTVRPFALLSGELNIAKVEVDDAWVDADLLDGKPQNLALIEISKPKAKPRGNEPAIRELHVHRARGHVAARTTGPDGPSLPFVLDLLAIDVDVTASGESTFVYEVKVERKQRDVAGVGTLVSPRTVINPPVPEDRFAPKVKIPFEPYDVLDEDALCDLGLDAQISDAPGSLTVTLKKLDIEARIDISDAPGTTPSCAAKDIHPEQIGAVHASGLDVVIPTGGSTKGIELVASRSDSRIQVRGSLAIVSRYVALPPMTGWADVTVTPAMRIDVSDPMKGLLTASLN
ncbi:MAG: hypothetical protein ACHREM_33385, partial [Polyangiales bacterium]